MAAVSVKTSTDYVLLSYLIGFPPSFSRTKAVFVSLVCSKKGIELCI